MYGFEELKKKIEVREDIVVCPVIGCRNQVKKMKKGTLKSLDGFLGGKKLKEAQFEEYLCKEHHIYITPTTFIYENIVDNFLWHNDIDINSLNKSMVFKRVKAQLHHDKSEDAVTWNVFRFLDKEGLISKYLENLSNTLIKNPELIFWSYSYSQQKTWKELKQARQVFREHPQQSSEPDLIISSENSLFFIETKITAPNKTDFNKNHSSEEKNERISRYSIGNGYLEKPIEEIIDSGYYQLMRFWLIGSTIAEKLNVDFYLINLVLSGREENVEVEFKRCIKEDYHKNFIRTTWEEVYNFIKNNAVENHNRRIILNYFKNKTIGYHKRRLQRSFLIS